MNQHAVISRRSNAAASDGKDTHPDAELLRLGRLLDEIAERERPIRERAHALSNHHRDQLDRKEITFDQFMAALKSPAVSSAFEAQEDINAEVDAVTEQIRGIRARTIKGLAVKIRALSHDASVQWKFDRKNPDELDWDIYCFQALFDETTDILTELD